MKRYTAEEVREQKISFKDLTKEQFNKLFKHFKQKYPDEYGIPPHGYNTGGFCARFYPTVASNGKVYSCSARRDTYTRLNTYARSTKEITYNQFRFSKHLEFKLEVTGAKDLDKKVEEAKESIKNSSFKSCIEAIAKGVAEGTEAGKRTINPVPMGFPSLSQLTRSHQPYFFEKFLISNSQNSFHHSVMDRRQGCIFPPKLFEVNSDYRNYLTSPMSDFKIDWDRVRHHEITSRSWRDRLVGELPNPIPEGYYRRSGVSIPYEPSLPLYKRGLDRDREFFFLKMDRILCDQYLFMIN